MCISSHELAACMTCEIVLEIPDEINKSSIARTGILVKQTSQGAKLVAKNFLQFYRASGN
jgi:hypothetical protein